ncbi:undecaprenyldiphospho-muramoylpentapeptide beta-N-acetylglucosaminyltransferase [Devriesea agamarum]|uniref:undecaprenyldiphospho-muramoylpentapeptide beta-N-acetylglucosaminyltransferase n=1 Tax=Devriesea agamarum TaxID=472569 RepID=UPI00071C743C|nr:undecaprenyldiphospho-muramoylpentapeptide beta-N-acetylglucosaminyltransferase [Devriesea agamarum]
MTSKSAPVRILLAGGGTSGHVSPLLATADALRRRASEPELVVLGTAVGLEADLVPAAGLELVTVPKVPFPRRPNTAALKFPGRLVGTVKTVRRLLTDRRIDAVVGFGGYVCPPAYIAARICGIPVVLHESNVRPGLANRLGAKSARHVTVAFDGTPLPDAVTIGMPMRREITQLGAGDTGEDQSTRVALRAQACAEFGLDPQRPVLLVTGGSLGAKRLNDAVAESARRIIDSGVQILHITGRGKLGATERPGYRAVEFISQMERAYAVADLAITRSGAGTVSELAAVGLPAILVPLPIGNGEQALNGRHLVEAGGALMVPDAELTAQWLLDHALVILHDPARLETMKSAVAKACPRDAAERLADLVLEAAHSHAVSAGGK